MRRVFSHPLVALFAGLCLRIYFVVKFPADAGDAGLYEQLAKNWLQNHVYGMNVGGLITSVDIRMPGYPGFLALVYALSGKTGQDARWWLMNAQIVVDLLTCVLIAYLAFVLAVMASEKVRPRRAFIAALWLAALCPFTANYVAVPLTETLATFFTALGILFLCLQLLTLRTPGISVISPAFWLDRLLSLNMKAELFAGLAGIAVGLGTLFRPETPLLLIAVSPVLAWVILRNLGWLPVIRNFALLGLGCVLPLMPWAIRNAVTLHEVQFIAPKNATLPGELVPYGFMAWEHTWLYRLRECYLVAWKLNDQAIQLEDIPERAFDSPEEKQRAAEVLEIYNDDMTWTPEEDAAFAQIAKDRTARHPLRTYFIVPAMRAFMMWMTPRIELLPFSGKVFPLAEGWEEDPVDQSVTVLFSVLNFMYLALASVGAWKLCRHKAARAAVALLAGFIVLRTAFLATLETPEPRYTLVCFPAILALAAYIFVDKKMNHEPPAQNT
jgi:hypothetical protein